MEAFIPDLCNLSRYTLEQALRLAHERNKQRPTYDFEISRFFYQYLNSRQVEFQVVERALDILSEIAPPARLLVILRAAIATDDPRVRSKSVLYLGQGIEDALMLEKLTTDNDPRVRANTIEALWGRQESDIEVVFLRATCDPHQRVAANGVYGLYLIDPEKHAPHVEILAKHSKPARRSAAAWLIGKICDGRHIGILKPLLLDPDAAVRSAAFRAVAALRSAREP